MHLWKLPDNLKETGTKTILEDYFKSVLRGINVDSNRLIRFNKIVTFFEKS